MNIDAGTNGSKGGTAYVVETSGLTKRFGDRVAVDDVDLRVPRGSAFGYLGPNGAGKTTLIRMLLGLTDATAGTMRLLGRPVPAERAAALARVGAIVEEPRFHGHLTGRENLTVIAAAREPEAHARIDGALARVGLSQRADERVKRYSLGMRQRLGVARSLLADPELLILDEPTNGLDPAGIHEFRAMIRGFVAEGRTVLLSSHLLDEVEKICDAVAIVDRGRVVMQGSIAELAAGGEQTILIATSDDERASAILAEHRAVESVAPESRRDPRPFSDRCGSRGRRGRHRSSPRPRRSRHPPLRAGPRVARAAVPGDHFPIGGSSMSTTTATTELPRRRTRAPRRPRLVGAEFLKLRKRRGLVLSTLALTVVPMIIAYTVLLILHAADPAKHGPAGGLENFSGSMDLLSQLGVVAAILVGATLGAGDLGLGRLPGAGRYGSLSARPLRGPSARRTRTGPRGRGGRLRRHGNGLDRVRGVAPRCPGASLLVSSAAWLALVTGLALVLALGVSSPLGSRGTTIGILLGWQLIAMPLAAPDRGTRLAPRRARRAPQPSASSRRGCSRAPPPCRCRLPRRSS